MVALEMGKNDVYCVTSQHGVIRVSLKNFLSNTYDRNVIDVDILDSELLSIYLKDQLNKKYDWLSFFHLPTSYAYSNSHWGNADMVAEALEVATHRFTCSYENITPTELWVDLQTYKHSEDSL